MQNFAKNIEGPLTEFFRTALIIDFNWIALPVHDVGPLDGLHVT